MYFRRSRPGQLGIILLLLVSMVTSTTSASVPKSLRCAPVRQRSLSSACSAVNRCCCAKVDARHGCVCRRPGVPAETPLPVPPRDQGPSFKWIAATPLPPSAALFDLPELPVCDHSRGYAPVAQSIQARLCVWRC